MPARARYGSIPSRPAGAARVASSDAWRRRSGETLSGWGTKWRTARSPCVKAGVTEVLPRELGYEPRNEKTPHLRGFLECAEEDSNLHPVIPDQALNLARLPIPPSARDRLGSIGGGLSR